MGCRCDGSVRTREICTSQRCAGRNGSAQPPVQPADTNDIGVLVYFNIGAGTQNTIGARYSSQGRLIEILDYISAIQKQALPPSFSGSPFTQRHSWLRTWTSCDGSL